MSWKIERVERIPDQSIECPVCNTHESFQHQTEMIKIIKSHASCIAGDSISFKVTSYYFPIMSADCHFCKAKGAGEERWGVYLCASCELGVHSLRFNDKEVV